MTYPTPDQSGAPAPVPDPVPASPEAHTPPAAPAPPFEPFAAPGSVPPAPPISAAPPPSGGWGGGTISKGLVAVLAPVLAVVMFAGGVFVERTASHISQPPAPTASATPMPSDAASELALIEQAWNELQDNYVDAEHLDNQALAYAAIRGMVDAVGDSGHTMFMTADEIKASEQSLSGTFVGIGVQVDQKDGWTTIMTVIPKTPAQEAGLKSGDQIKAVDGVSTEGKTVEEVVAIVRGPEGEKVTLTIGRAGSADFDVTITRRKFDLPLVSWAMVPGRTVAMIRLDQFATGATKAIQDAIKGARDAGATALILDLRGNPGGYVNEAVGVASQFVGDGNVYQSFDRSGTKTDQPVEKGGLALDLPLVVLADEGTASAAEIVTGAIQDAGRATVVGVKTFGTGTVLGRFDLQDGSALRIGIERWLTRNGRPIWHEGLEPDVTVTLPDGVGIATPDDIRDLSASDLARSQDAQLVKALELLNGKG